MSVTIAALRFGVRVCFRKRMPNKATVQSSSKSTRAIHSGSVGKKRSGLAVKKKGEMDVTRERTQPPRTFHKIGIPASERIRDPSFHDKESPAKEAVMTRIATRTIK